MPHDPVRVADTRAWLEKPGKDLRSAEVLLAAEPPLVEDALFHCQQAVEKALKAFLTWHDKRFRKTHSIEEIGDACLEIDRTLASLVERSVPLSEFAWRFRYPGAGSDPLAAEVDPGENLAVAREVLKAIRDRLPKEFRP